MINRHFQIEITDEEELLKSFKSSSFFSIPAENIYEKGYDTEPHCEYEKPIDFPNCCENHRNSLKNLLDWYERFPDCCDSHRMLIQKKWFSKDKYSHIVDKILLQTEYTTNFILKNIDSKEWYKNITNYIEYIFESFGIPNVGATQYFSSIEYYISNNDELYTADNKWKRTQLIEFLNTYKLIGKESDKKTTDINLLQSTFQKWVKALPEILVFGDLKRLFTNKFPLNLYMRDPQHNQFTGLTKFKIRSKNELIEILVKQTQLTLEYLSSQNTYISGNESEKEKYELSILIEQHNLEQKKLLNSFSKKETVYVKILKKWLSNEKEFIGKVKPILSKENQKKLNLHDFQDTKFHEELLDQIFFYGQNLEKFKTLHEKFDEETFRDFFLPHLNLISKNHCATGETFNKIGRTDILIQDLNGQNVFIAECKIWKGEKELLRAVDQLLERYIGWRDEKTALIFFNKQNADFSNVVEKANEAIKKHILFDSFSGQSHSTSFKYIFSNKEDLSKKIQLELILFNCN